MALEIVDSISYETVRVALKNTRELQTPAARRLQLSSLESLVEVRGREMLRTMLEEHIELRGPGEIGASVTGSDDLTRTHRRERNVTVATIFGEVSIGRLIYSKPGTTSLAPCATRAP